MFKLKKLKFLSFYVLIFSASSNSIAQTNELGFHISPAILAPAQFNRDTSIVNARSSIATSAGRLNQVKLRHPHSLVNTRVVRHTL